MSKLRVVIAMSGGVDSSVAAALLKEEGYQLSGVTMKIWDGESTCKEGLRHACYGPGEREDILDARKVAERLDIPLNIIDMKQEYKSYVLDYFYKEYLIGRTPNPCIRCNCLVKFGALIERLKGSFDYFATGHYARIEQNKTGDGHLLKKGVDENKDQSYFLYSLSQEQLGFSLFPLGIYTKEETRKIAKDLGLGVDERQESQDFIAGGYSQFFASKPGPILDKEGKIIGEHRGIPFYTIGQRKGLNLSKSIERLYVIAMNYLRNAIMVGKREDLFGDELIASDLNWIAIKELKAPVKLKAKIRYRHKEIPAEISPLDGKNILVKFVEPQMAITPGQAIVFYDGEIVVGGGTIAQCKMKNEN
ncbi:tRNA 2-thiouridine(34) synthase MnmA [candidate division WOR-3 bacterium]|nr:tRNA 2-thiouridine(34) synthase MnmA [candidate division WOR-3 bacterium]